MYLSDSTLHSAIDGISRTLGIYVEVEGAEYAPASIIRLEWENECIDGSNFTIGGTLSNRIELEIYHDESILVGDQIKPSVEIEVEGEMIRIPLGIFYVDSVSVNKEITTLTAYDAMISLDKEYIPSANHTNLKALASDVCQQAGIMMKGTVENVSIKGSLSGYSYRETLGFIASFHAGNMVVDRDGQFKIKTYDRVNRTIPNHAYFSFDQKDTYRVSGVMCNFGDVGVGRGDDTAQCVTFENPYVTDAHMDAIYLKLKDLTFVAGTLKYRGDMNLDAGDLFTLTDANGHDHLLLCGQNQLTFTGGLTGTLISIGEGQGVNQYVEYQFKNKKSLTQLTVELGSIQAKINEVENKIEGDLVTSEEMSSAIEMAKDSIELGVSSQITTTKNEVISTASSDATKKANQAKTEAINSANNTLTSTIANYYTKTETDSKINIAKESIELGVSTNYETKSNVETKITTAKNEAINSANNTLTSTIANYYTKAQTDSKINVAKDSITSSVSNTYETKADVQTKFDNLSTELKSTTSSLEKRVSTAESKITTDAITNTVKQNFYTKTETDGQITSKGYQTASQVQQTVDSVKFNFRESGGANILLNSKWTHGMTHWSALPSNHSRIIDSDTGYAYIRAEMVTGYNAGISQTFKVEKGRTYTVSAQVDVEVGSMAGVEFSYTDSTGTKQWRGTNTTHTSNYQNGILFYTNTFDMSGTVSVLFYACGKASGAVTGKYIRWRWVQVEQGNYHSQWTPHPNEVYSGQTYIDKNGVRVNSSKVGTYTEMNAGGLFVKKDNGNLLFEGSNKIALYDGKGTSCLMIVNDPSASYGNARIDLRGGINFIHNTGVSVGTNQILLGNDDRADKYGFHNLAIRAHNSLGFMDNNGYTHMYFATRTGRIIMKGALYQNTSTPPSSFFLSNDESDDLYFSGYTKQDMVNAILGLDTQIQVDYDEDYTMKISPSSNELITTMIDDQPHIDQSSIIAGLVETVKMLNERITLLEQKLEETSK